MFAHTRFCFLESQNGYRKIGGCYMENQQENTSTTYSALFQPKREVKVIKKDGSLEAFNVQKVIDAVGKSAYRALTKFTDEEKEHICQFVVD